MSPTEAIAQIRAGFEALGFKTRDMGEQGLGFDFTDDAWFGFVSYSATRGTAVFCWPAKPPRKRKGSSRKTRT